MLVSVAYPGLTVGCLFLIFLQCTHPGTHLLDSLMSEARLKYGLVVHHDSLSFKHGAVTEYRQFSCRDRP